MGKELFPTEVNIIEQHTIAPAGVVESSIVKAFEACAETQRLMALPYLTAEQVAKVYPVSKSVLDKMRMERIGPEFVQVREKGTVAYTHKAVRDWLNRHRQRVMQ